MRRLTITALTALLLTSACASNQRQAAMSWGDMTASTSVARVNVVQPLITPGFY